VPWEHCGNATITDDAVCPACGITKGQWTVQWNATRTFRVGRPRGMLNLELLDAEGAPVAGEPFLATLPDQVEHQGATDESGRAVVPSPDGACVVRFPERVEGDVEPPASATGSLGAGFRVPAGRKQTFRLTGVLTEFVIDDGDSGEAVGKGYTLTLPDGRTVDGTICGRKRVRVVTVKGGAGAKVKLDLRAEGAHAPAEEWDPKDADWGAHAHGDDAWDAGDDEGTSW
jgi:hypothetical protein